MGAIVCLILAAQLGPVLLVSSDETLSSHLTYLEDPSADLTFTEVSQARYQDSFMESEKNVPNFGFTNSAYWFKVTVTNRTTLTDWVLDVEYPVVDYVDLYVVRDARADVQHLRGGDMLPFDTRYRSHPSINYPLKLAAGETAQIYLRAHTSGSMQLPLRISSEREFGERAATESIRNGLYYGLILAMVFFNGFLFFATTDRSYVFYCGYLLSYLAVQMSLNGALYQYVFPNAPHIFNAGLPVYMGLTAFCVASFTISFLEMRLSFPRLYRVGSVMAILSLLIAFVSLFVPYQAIIRFSLGLATLTAVFSMIAGIYGWTQGKRTARYFVTAWTVFVGGVLLYSLKAFGVLPTNALTTHSVQIGSALEVLLLAMALGDRYELMRHESIQLHKTTLEVQSHLNRELLGKMHIFSDVAHRLNNPLNYVAAGVAATEDEVREVRTTVMELLVEDAGDEDPEVNILRQRFNGNFDKIGKMLEQIVVGQSRASRFVEELRGLNEVDGKSLEPVAMGTLIAMAEKRLIDDWGEEDAASIKLIFESAEAAQQEVVGNRYLLALAFESLVEQLLESRTQSSKKVSILNIRHVSSENDMLSLDVATPLSRGEYDSLAEAFQANSAEPSMSGRYLVLAKGLFEEQGGTLKLRERLYEGTAEVIMNLSLPATRVKAAKAARGA